MKVTRNIDTGDEKQTIRTISTKPKEHFEGRWKSGRLYPLYSVVVNNGTTFISQNAKMKEEPYVIYDADKKEFKAPDGWLIKEMSADSRVTALGGGGEGGVTPDEVEEMIKDKVDKVDGKGLSTNDYDNAEKNKVASAYQKPNNGIPKSDLAKAVQDLLDDADGAYKKPVTGIPFTDLADGVQDSLSNADEAKAGLAGKQDTISDLSAIRSGAAAGATSVQPGEFNELKDEVATIGNGAYEEAWDGDSTPVVADIPAGVVVTYSSASYTGTLAASASTVDKIYLVSDGNGNYDRYTTVEANGAYSWKKVGSTAIPLSNYATNSKVSQLQQEVTDLFAVEILNGTYPVAANLGYIPCSFKQGKKYVVEFSWEYTSGGLAYLVVRQGDGPLVNITPNYYTSRGSEKVDFNADSDYNNLIVINYGGETASGNVTLSVKESYDSEDIKADIDAINEDISELGNEPITIDRLSGIAKGAVNEAAKNLGYIVEKDNQPTYENLGSSYFIAPIPIGSVITNNGIKVALASDTVLTNRHDIQPGETWVASAEINVIRSLEVSGNVRLVINTKNTLFSGMSIDGSKITEDSVEINRLSFVETGTNIYDQANDSGFVSGFLGSNGSINSNPSYNTSGFIKVEPNTKYGYVAGWYLRFSLEYDEYKNPITATYTDSPTTFTTSANARFVRVTFYVGENRYFLCKGEPKPYEDYKTFIPNKYLQTDAPGSGLPFFLPKHIYVANGRTIEIYYNQVLLNADRYNIQATCPIGKALERKFQIIGDTSHIGNTYTLSLVAYNDSGEVVASGTSTIHIVSNTISASKNVLPVGDSLTNDKPWLSELHTLSANLNTVGTRQGIHEGRSGAAVSTYTNVSGGIVYDYDNQYSDNTVPVFDASASYGIGDKVKIAHTFGNGTSGYRYWVFKQAHSPGAFNESEAYCYSGGNPFYDYVNDKISFSFYRSFFGINYDAIILYLGTNGINLEPETNPNGALGIKNLIESIREDEPTTPILVINTIFRSNQNGIGNQGNTDGYVAQSAYKFNEDKKVLLLAKAVDDLCGSMSNVYLCPVGFTHDSKYNFGNNKVQVNPRLTSTDDVFELQPSDSVHPQTPGYMQMADEMFSTLCAVFGS